jgi:hypothetical protein
MMINLELATGEVVSIDNIWQYTNDTNKTNIAISTWPFVEAEGERTVLDVAEGEVERLSLGQVGEHGPVGGRRRPRRRLRGGSRHVVVRRSTFRLGSPSERNDHVLRVRCILSCVRREQNSHTTHTDGAVGSVGCYGSSSRSRGAHASTPHQRTSASTRGLTIFLSLLLAALLDFLASVAATLLGL